MSKAINFIVVLITFAIAATFGLSAYLKHKKFAALDAEYENGIALYFDKLDKDLLASIDINNKNNEANQESPDYDNDEVPTGEIIRHTNFLSLYSASLSYYNNAENIYSTGSGFVDLSGAYMGGMINSARQSLSFTRAKNFEGKKFFEYSLNGYVNGTPFDLYSQHYANRSSYAYYYPKTGWMSLNEQGYRAKFKWGITDLFYIINESSIKEIKSFYFDEYSKNYFCKLLLNPTIASANYGTILKGLVSADSAATFTKIELNFIITENYKFKSITSIESYTLKGSNGLTKIDAKCESTYTENFAIVGSGRVNITPPKNL